MRGRSNDSAPRWYGKKYQPFCFFWTSRKPPKSSQGMITSGAFLSRRTASPRLASALSASQASATAGSTSPVSLESTARLAVTVNATKRCWWRKPSDKSANSASGMSSRISVDCAMNAGCDATSMQAASASGAPSGRRPNRYIAVKSASVMLSAKI